MNTIWQSVTWDVARAGGFTADVLLTLAVVVGLALSTQLQSPSRWPRLLNSELHNFLTLLIFALATVHGIGTGSDTQTWWALGIYVVSIALVGSLLCRRVFSSTGKLKHAPAQPARSVGASAQSNPRALNNATWRAPAGASGNGFA